MNVLSVKKVLKEHNLIDEFLEFETSSATVELAAKAVGCEKGRIAKTLTFKISGSPIAIVVMGEAKVDNKKFKETFGEKAKFLKSEEVLEMIGHPIGGVCPFALKEEVKIYLDESLKKFNPIYPAAGAPNNAVKITLEQLETITKGKWVDVCKIE